ncbi:MAG: hypothetical protein H6831_05440 [Planctomycetes bacterium]|nr:hypothetical protein [Planctomycetota bacterium]MCB9903832.1 hypothetical protein [Planctomycetota bacterium]
MQDRKLSAAERWGVTLLLAVGGSFLICIEYLEVLTRVLPETDGAHGIGAFGDPFVLALALMVSTCGAFLTWPIAMLAWRRRNVVRCGLATIACMVVAVPLSLFALGPRALAAVPVVLLAGIACFTRWPRGERWSELPNGFDEAA